LSAATAPGGGWTAAQAGLRHAIETRVLERFAPAHVVVNRDGDILHYSARTGRYLEAPAGTPNRHLLAMARKGLRLELRSALQEATETGRTVKRTRVAVEDADHIRLVEIIIEPIREREGEPLFLVLFRDVDEPPMPAAQAEDATDPRQQEVRELRDRLQMTIEEYETAVEELKSSNEELQSINEELQSTNEELETSKEELQSLNEELHTVNAELNDKIEEVDRANADLRNIFESTRLATAFLDKNLVIRSFTPAITAIFNLISTDRGRPLTDIVSHLEDVGDLHRDIRTVFERGDIIERRVRRNDGKTHYLMRILPYRTHDSEIEGALVTFVDVTGLVEAEARQRLLLQELNQSAGSIFSIFGRLPDEPLRPERPHDRFSQAFRERVRSLARSYDLLSHAEWNGLALQEIISAQLDLLDADMRGRVAVQGPDIAFKPAAALALGAIFHELVTNAAAHGALSKPAGCVAVTWRAEGSRDETLVVNWRESGGPSVTKPPAPGFGISLIERELAALGGALAFDLAATGIEARISLPVAPNQVTAVSRTRT
jgi:two-component system CheB/CheR fusion protein